MTGGSSGGQSRGELVDLVRAEARPVVLIGDDDWRLQVAEGLDLLESGRVLAEVEDLVLDALAVQCAVRRVALHAGGLCVNRDCHAVCVSFVIVLATHGKEVVYERFRIQRVPCPRANRAPAKEYYPL